MIIRFIPVPDTPSCPLPAFDMGKQKGGGGATKIGVQTIQQLLVQSVVSVREEANGKLQTRGGARNPKYLLILDHLRGLALWEEVPLCPLGAFLGHQYAAAAEALGAPSDTNLISCQRCETILHPGGNCTVRVEKVNHEGRRRRKNPINTKNNVAYKCHFCSHTNLKRGTSRHHMNAILPPKHKPAEWKLQKAGAAKGGASRMNSMNSTEMAFPVMFSGTKLALPSIVEDMSPWKHPASPATTGTSLLDAKRKKRNRSGAKKAIDKESNSAVLDPEKPASVSQKRKRGKSWTSLKEIVEKKDHLPVPFFI